MVNLLHLFYIQTNLKLVEANLVFLFYNTHH
nr:MAG TPA: hypothetical protein [Caudoviricetes sp.]